jgi:RimJ/RimL family protein N-acetyltransferase
MHDIKTSVKDLVLTRPDPDRDASFALGWFESPYGKETLLLMGNTEVNLNTPSIEQETDRINDFLKLEKENKQLTWMIRYDDRTIGAVWLELQDTDHVKSPAFHIMIGDKNYRGKGFGKAIIQEMITYTKDTLKSTVLYSRYLTSNSGIAHVTKSFGFIDDGNPYRDNDGLEFQNIKRDL